MDLLARTHPMITGCMRFCFLALLALAPIVRADEWQTIDGCRLTENKFNDGDSFHVKANGEERIFRLYFVDCPEAEADDGRVKERIAEQGKEFGITEEEVIEMGEKAAAFTQAVLSRPFKVTTKGEDAMGGSQLSREYALVETADGEDLGEMLVSRGLARSHGDAAAPPEKKVGELRSKYNRLEEKARRERLGAWGDGASIATMELGPAGDEGVQDGEPTGAPDVTDLIPSAVEITEKDAEME